mmetsp:Transcript_4126/g.8079  ORF Transcript_4126/g.8079 Transcript_4126/m.8079 type:complete len:325 (+) Transcript_4126:955-1929(+)
MLHITLKAPDVVVQDIAVASSSKDDHLLLHHPTQITPDTIRNADTNMATCTSSTSGDKLAVSWPAGSAVVAPRARRLALDEQGVPLRHRSRHARPADRRHARGTERLARRRAAPAKKDEPTGRHWSERGAGQTRRTRERRQSWLLRPNSTQRANLAPAPLQANIAVLALDALTTDTVNAAAVDFGVRTTVYTVATTIAAAVSAGAAAATSNVLVQHLNNMTASIDCIDSLAVFAAFFSSIATTSAAAAAVAAVQRLADSSESRDQQQPSRFGMRCKRRHGAKCAHLRLERFSDSTVKHSACCCQTDEMGPFRRSSTKASRWYQL